MEQDAGTKLREPEILLPCDVGLCAALEFYFRAGLLCFNGSFRSLEADFGVLTVAERFVD